MTTDTAITTTTTITTGDCLYSLPGLGGRIGPHAFASSHRYDDMHPDHDEPDHEVPDHDDHDEG